MRVCVLGLWHLGSVTAACLAAAGHEVVGLDFDPATVERLAKGEPPVFEPGLAALVTNGLGAGRLRFTTDAASAVAGAEVVWVAYDTPVDEEDRADVGYVLQRVTRLFAHLGDGALVLLSSQLPVGTTRQLERTWAAQARGRSVHFACSPENLRLGRAISVFTQPDRVVVGVASDEARARVAELLKPMSDRIEWMSIESAEMTKHALNAFLATSVTFINEIAAIAEQVGADAKEIERGLKTDMRIGLGAYLSPGTAFAGGTLARDLAFLTAAGGAHHVPTHLLSAVRASNDAHKGWIRRRLHEVVRGSLSEATIAVWGLTYKPGTSTLRRSAAVELCRALVAEGATVRVHDPTVADHPAELDPRVTIARTPLSAAQGASALVVATEWPAFREVDVEAVVQALHAPVVIDPARFLSATLGRDPRVRYVTIGKGAP